MVSATWAWRMNWSEAARVFGTSWNGVCRSVQYAVSSGVAASKSSAEGCESIFGSTTLVVQPFVDADHPGDKRVVVVGGEVLEVDGHVAGIERHPASNDFRANLHAGGSAHSPTLSAGALDATKYAANFLHENGIWLAGVDLIGDKIIEFNVFSTGGLYDSIKFSGISFDDLIVERLLG